MKIMSMRLAGIRCFDDTGTLDLSPQCNLFVGQNNAGKSTLLKGLLTFQGFPFDHKDARPEGAQAFCEIVVGPVSDRTPLRYRPGGTWDTIQAYYPLGGLPPRSITGAVQAQIDGNGLFRNVRPDHFIVPFVARRKATAFQEGVSTGNLNTLDGTFANLYTRIDHLAVAGHPRHEMFQAAVHEIVGLPITTRASTHGKEAGFYLDLDTFVSLDRMGDGVSEMMALIVELCIAENKLFVIEEPETNLHPKGLKALLAMIRESWGRNQFVIATHSNIVVRELGYDDDTKVWRVYRTGAERLSPSVVEEVAREPAAHAELLRDLGYEFGDLGLHEGWLFLEESSAEQIIRDVLIPTFTPELKGRLRTFSASGAGKLEPSLSEFQRLITFVHLQPVYEGKTWVRADGDVAGIEVIDKLREKFKAFTDETCATFSATAFEHYYPAEFADQAQAALAITDKRAKREAKAALLREVLQWTRDNPTDAGPAWATSAAEPIALLKNIRDQIAP